MLKLSKLTLHSPVLAWIGNFLYDRKLFVNAENYHSEFTTVISGVPQGSEPSALLFNTTHYLPAAVSCHIRHFPCDCILYRAFSNVALHTAQLDDLDEIQEWCFTWQMWLTVYKYNLHQLLAFPLHPISIRHFMAPTQLPVLLSNTYRYSSNWRPFMGYSYPTYNYQGSWYIRCLKAKSKVRSSLFEVSTIYILSHTWAPMHFLSMGRHQDYQINNVKLARNHALRFIFSEFYETSVWSISSRADLPNILIEETSMD